METRISLAALRAVEAAARRRSYTLAAEELYVTHSAVSHQIRLLEKHLGAALFVRSGPQMLPTAACERLALRLRQSLGDIGDALREAAADDAAEMPPLQLSVMADFAQVWLIRHLDDFSRAHPHIGLSLTIHTAVDPPDPRSVDLGIWHRRIDAHGFRSLRLPQDRVIAVCSPSFKARYPELTTEDLPRVPLLRFGLRSWKEFFESAEVNADEPPHGVIFTDAGALLTAALAGQGAAMVRRQMAAPYIRDGALVQIGATDIPAYLDYFISWQEGHRREAAIASFYQWLQDRLDTTAASEA